MLRIEIKKILIFMLCFLQSPASDTQLFLAGDPKSHMTNTDQEKDEQFHLSAIYILNSNQSRRWKIWINDICICSNSPKTCIGEWHIIKVEKEYIVLQKGTKEKVIFIQKNKNTSEKKHNRKKNFSPPKT